MFFKLTISFLVCALATVSAQSFTDLVENIATERVRQVVEHPLYVEIAKGTLPTDKFKHLLDQDHWYIIDYMKVFAIMAARERDIDRKALLEAYSADTWAYEPFTHYYNPLNFSISSDIRNYTQSYMNFLTNGAIHSSLGEALAATAPCYLVWHKMGLHINAIANLPQNPNHPYGYWISGLDGSDTSHLEKYKAFVNGYYDRADVDIKGRMLSRWVSGVEQEFSFATGIYNSI